MDLQEVAKAYQGRLRSYLRWEHIPERVLDDVMQETFVIACRRPIPDTDVWTWLRDCAKQARVDNRRAYDHGTIDVPTVSLDMPHALPDGETVSYHDIIAGHASAEHDAQERETMRLLRQARQRAGTSPQPTRHRQRLEWRRQVAQHIRALHLDIAIRIVVGQCPTCLGPLHEDADGRAVVHRCVLVENPAIVVDPVKLQQRKWSGGRTCALVDCHRGVKRGNLFCPDHYTMGRQVVSLSRKKPCVWCGVNLARSGRPYCSRDCKRYATLARGTARALAS